MRNVITRIMCAGLALLFFVQPFCSAHAFSNENRADNMRLVSQYTEQISEDLYIEFSVYEEHIITRSSPSQIVGTKTATGKNSDGTIIWKFIVRGVFEVNQGISAVCTSSVSSHEIYNNDWHFSGSTCRVSGNQAIGDAEFIRKLLGIKVETEICHVVLTCDVNGSLS